MKAKTFFKYSAIISIILLILILTLILRDYIYSNISSPDYHVVSLKYYAVPHGSFDGQIIKLINRERALSKLAPLKEGNAMDEIALQRLNYVTTDWSHEATISGMTYIKIAHEINVQYKVIGENLARGYNTPEAVIKAWLESPEHKKNLLDPDYTYVGIQTIYYQDHPYTVAIFGDY